ncbi:hypothetical protein NDU88_003675 [Pleurodeles waltl]|uniref:Uncharacterized protein n=1 Tax=Pleurodeles waltl TaxID=8319 RepID=A0AAV7NIW5_PLEWA|nr:hypothetical protein NDU88_003675 [Pleurodeles waltl]
MVAATERPVSHFLSTTTPTCTAANTTSCPATTTVTCTCTAPTRLQPQLQSPASSPVGSHPRLQETSCCVPQQVLTHAPPPAPPPAPPQQTPPQAPLRQTPPQAPPPAPPPTRLQPQQQSPSSSTVGSRPSLQEHVLLCPSAGADPCTTASTAASTAATDTAASTATGPAPSSDTGTSADMATIPSGQSSEAGGEFQDPG